MHSSPGKSESLANQVSTEDINKRDSIDSDVNSDLSEFEGAPGSSPFYHSMVTSGHEGVHSGYDSARMNNRMQARAAGFGYEQPTTQGGDAEINSQEASDQSKVERDALTQEAGMRMQAAGLREGEMSQFNPNASIATEGNLENQRLNRRMQIFQSLAKLGVAGATMGLGAAGVGNFGNS